jgi:hypothetical protein
MQSSGQGECEAGERMETCRARERWEGVARVGHVERWRGGEREGGGGLTVSRKRKARETARQGKAKQDRRT